MNLRHPRAAVFGIWGLVAMYLVMQAAIWIAAGGMPRRPMVLAQVIGAWVVMLVLAALASSRIEGLSRNLTQEEQDRRTAVDEVSQLQLRKEMLEIVARTVDVPLAFQALAERIVQIVPCDRVGLALLAENNTEFQTYTARVDRGERRLRPRPEIVFTTDQTALGRVVRSREPLIIADTSDAANELLDVNVLHTSGFASAMILPLVARGRAVGTINAVARKRDAFHQEHADALLPIAELFAVAHVAQQLQVAIGRYRLMEAMSELTIVTSSEINGALQAIIGHCDLIERGYPDSGLHRDLATVVRQAQRISGLLEKLRAAAHERMTDVTEKMNQAGIPSSPEAYGDADTQAGNSTRSDV